MIDHEQLYDTISRSVLKPWLASLPAALDGVFSAFDHGDLPKWQSILDRLPTVQPSSVILDKDAITVGKGGDLTSQTSVETEELLRQLHPWRKGPYNLFDIHIDAEWRSNMKWNRLRHHIQPLANRVVLDVGCGNGYYGWRMLGEGAKLIIGIDPTLLSVVQFYAVRHFAEDRPVFVLPFRIQDLPPKLRTFDTVFSMGVFYHRRSPLDHLFELRDCLRPGGELILETLIIDGKQGQALVPPGRYAKMRNVWFIPSCGTLEGWLQRCGYQDIRLIDVSQTGSDEQRSTEWMKFQSLSDFLNPKDPMLTCEGLPAPKRAIFLANSP